MTTDLKTTNPMIGTQALPRLVKNADNAGVVEPIFVRRGTAAALEWTGALSVGLEERIARTTGESARRKLAAMNP